MHKRYGGNRVGIIHRRGKTVTGEFLHSGMAHLESITVKTGQWVKRGQQIGTIGTSGAGVTSGVPHLHMSVGAAKHRQYGFTFNGFGDVIYQVEDDISSIRMNSGTMRTKLQIR